MFLGSANSAARDAIPIMLPSLPRLQMGQDGHSRDACRRARLREPSLIQLAVVLYLKG